MKPIYVCLLFLLPVFAHSQDMGRSTPYATFTESRQPATIQGLIRQIVRDKNAHSPRLQRRYDKKLTRLFRRADRRNTADHELPGFVDRRLPKRLRINLFP